MSFTFSATRVQKPESGIIPSFMPMRPGVEVAAVSDVGCQRENNEDSYLYWEPVSDEQFQHKGRLAIVADGMGGHEGGQDASRIAIEAIREMYAVEAQSDPQSLLDAGFREAHARIHDYALKNEHLRGMGTTATAVAVLGKQLYYAHIGDSRLYRVRGSEVSRLTHDHSYVSRLVADGVLTEEEAEVHPQRNILTAALGVGPEIAPDAPAQPIFLQSKDHLVLCSDGLWGLVNDQEIRTFVTKQKPQAACQAMVDLAKKRGGPDNITVQILRLD